MPAQPPIAQPAKSKTTAIILAVIFGEFVWLYTYNKNWKKFWPSLLASFIAYNVNPLAGLAVSLLVWIWAIVDTARKPAAYFALYPQYSAGNPQVQAAGAAGAAISSNEDAYQTFLPTKNKFALKSYYYGCIGIVPVLGLPFTILALTNGRKALRQYATNPTPGAKGHAKTGIVLAYCELVILAILIAIFVAALVVSNGS